MSIQDAFKDILPIIAESAPIIAKVIGGPVGLAAGYAIPILAHAFDVDSENVDKIVESITKDPEASAKLSRCEETHADWLTYLMKIIVFVLILMIN